MAKAKKAKESEPEMEGLAGEEGEVSYDPDTFVCLDGTYVENADAAQRPRVILAQGGQYEHTHEDARGVWCYRLM